MGKLDGSEQVLCIPRAAFRKHVPDDRPGFRPCVTTVDGPNGERLFDALDSWCGWLARTDDLEHDSSWLQLIPYGVIVRNGRVLAYVRAKAGSEGRLHGKASVGIGGHVNPCDAVNGTDQPSGLKSLLLMCLEREVAEEVGPIRYGLDTAMIPFYFGQCRGMILPDSEGVGAVHVGFVFTVEAPADWEPTPAPEVVACDWHTPDDMATPAFALRGPIEPWSAAVLPHLPDWTRSA